MTAAQVSLIAATWRSLSADQQVFAQAFYDELFIRSPALRRLFAKDLSEQERKLTIALDTIVTSLATGRDIDVDLRALGKRHARYGVDNKDYAVVGDAFIFALQHCLGTAFTAEARSAWTSAYELISGEMKCGAEE